MPDFERHYETPEQAELKSIATNPAPQTLPLPVEKESNTLAGNKSLNCDPNDPLSQEDHLAEKHSGEREIAHREKALALAESDPRTTNLALAARHSLLCEQYNLMGNRRFSTEHLKKANDYWFSALNQASKEGDKALHSGDLAKAVECYRKELLETDKKLLTLWTTKSSRPSKNPLSSGIYERVANANLRQSKITKENLTEACKNLSLASESLLEYHKRFSNCFTSLKQLQLIAINIETLAKLVSMDEQRVSDYIADASFLLEELAFLEEQVKELDKRNKAENYGYHNPALIPLLSAIAKFHSLARPTDAQRKLLAEESEELRTHKLAINALERVLSLQTKAHANKADRLETLQNLAEEYSAINDIKGLTIYTQAILLAEQDKNLIPTLRAPAHAPTFLDYLCARLKKMPKPLKEADTEIGKYLIDFSKTTKKIAGDQLASKKSAYSAENYILAMDALRTALGYIDGRFLDPSTLAEYLKILECLQKVELTPTLIESGRNLCDAAYAYIKENFNDGDQRLQPMLTKIADFYLNNNQCETTIKILLHSRQLLQARALDKREKLKQYTAISLQIAEAQSRCGKMLDAVTTSSSLLRHVQAFFSGKDTSEILTALHHLSYHHQKHAESLTPKKCGKDLKAFSIKDALAIKQQEIDMAKRLKLKDDDIKDLKEEYKSIQHLQNQQPL